MVLFSGCAAYADSEMAWKVQAALDAWVAQRAPIEKVTGIAAYISLGDPGPAIEAFAGRTGRADDDRPVDQDTLFQMGSTSKSFAAAIVLKLEAAGILSLDDAIGKWLPEYSAWSDVSLRRLLNMTSGIPNYSETETLSRIWADEPDRHLSAEELIDAVYPVDSRRFPDRDGYYYSNTNYILAGLIASRATGKSYRDLVHEMVIEPVGLSSTFYESGAYPGQVMARLAHGYFENAACADYQPKDCQDSWNLPLVGRDVRTMSLSWAQAAGGAISNPRDVSRWVRTMFSGSFVPAEQQTEWLSMVSTRTGEPLAEVSADEPQGFALGLVRGVLGSLGAQWFYQGETLGYRTLYVWLADDDIVITVQTNSQPPDGEDRLHEVILTLYDAIKPNRPAN